MLGATRHATSLLRPYSKQNMQTSNEKPRLVAVVLAGGAGTRVGGQLPKQFQRLGGRTMLSYSLQLFAQQPEVEAIAIVAPEPFVPALSQEYLGRKTDSDPLGKVAHIIPGGSTRHLSCLNALRTLGEYSHNDRVLFHDADRPFLPKPVLQRLVDAVQTADAATLVMPVADSIVAVNSSPASLQYLDRGQLRRVQTPQAFRFGVLRAALKAHEAGPDAGEFTDTVSFALQHTRGLRIALVEGDEANFKITTPFDMVVAEAYASLHDPNLD